MRGVTASWQEWAHAAHHECSGHPEWEAAVAREVHRAVADEEQRLADEACNHMQPYATICNHMQ